MKISIIVILSVFVLTSCYSNKYENLNYKDQLIVELLIMNILHSCVDLGIPKSISIKTVSEYCEQYDNLPREPETNSKKMFSEYCQRYGNPPNEPEAKEKWEDGLDDWCNDSSIKYSAELFYLFNDPNIYIQIDGYKVNDKIIRIAQEKINALLQTDNVCITLGKRENFPERHIYLNWHTDKSVNVNMGTRKGPLSGYEESFQMKYRNGRWRRDPHTNFRFY